MDPSHPYYAGFPSMGGVRAFHLSSLWGSHTLRELFHVRHNFWEGSSYDTFHLTTYPVNWDAWHHQAMSMGTPQPYKCFWCWRGLFSRTTSPPIILTYFHPIISLHLPYFQPSCTNSTWKHFWRPLVLPPGSFYKAADWLYPRHKITVN